MIEKTQSLQQMLGKLDIHMQKTETRSLSFTLPQNQLKVDQRPYYKAWNCETTPGNSRKYIEHIGIGNNFLNKLKTQPLREATNKWDYTKLKSFCTAKETVTRLLSSDKGLISRIYRELNKLSPQRINTPEKMGTWIKQGILKGRGANGQ
jgi:hypothetical protein